MYKEKCREGVIDRVVDENTVIGRGFFKKGTDFNKYLGLKVQEVNEQGKQTRQGILESSFGKTGKYKVTFREQQKATGQGEGEGEGEASKGSKLLLPL